MSTGASVHGWLQHGSALLVIALATSASAQAPQAGGKAPPATVSPTAPSSTAPAPKPSPAAAPSPPAAAPTGGSGAAGTEPTTAPPPAAATPAPTPKASTPSPEQARAAALRSRAEQIRQLMAGSLDPEVSLASLLRLDLTDPALADRAHWLALLQDLEPKPEKPPQRRWQKKPKPPPTPQPQADLTPEQDLQAALRDLLRLPPETRSELIETHRARRRALESERARVEELRQTLEALRLRRKQLEAFLERRLEPDVEPRTLLSLGVTDLSSPDLGARMKALSGLLAADPEPQPNAAAAALEQAPPAPTTEPGSTSASGPPSPATPPATPTPSATAGSSPTPTTAAAPSPPSTEPSSPATAPSPEAIAAEHSRIDTLLARYLRLTPDARNALFEAHESRKHPPEEAPPVESEQHKEAIEAADRAREHANVAAEKRRQALEAARQAKSHSRRLLEQERARLHAVEEAQARMEEQLSKKRARLGADREEALGWTERVTKLSHRSIFETPHHDDAERLYRGINAVLDRLHEELGQALFAIVASTERTTTPGERLDDELLHEEHRGQLDALWSKLTKADAHLSDLEAELRWDHAHELRDAVVTLNHARLDALSLCSTALYNRATGTGAEGFAVAHRELTQVTLELRYHVLELPRNVAQWGEAAQQSQGTLVLKLLQLLAILLLFRAWRRNANRWLTRLRRAFRERLIQSWGTRFVATFAWYVRRIHKPLDWLVLIWLMLGTSNAVPEVRFVRLVLMWVLTGSLVVLVLDAMASRQSHRGPRGNDNSALRMRSLRLVGLTVVVLGLILSLTEESVGQGAIYAWTLTLCWVLAFPITLVLVSWWRTIIFDRLEVQEHSNRLARTLAAKRTGVMSVPAATLGGAFLLVGGLSRWVRDQVYEFELMRRLLAYLVRSRVVRQSKAAESRSGRPATLITDIQARFFRPDVAPDRVVDYASEELAEVATFACEENATLTAIVAERGRGKSTFLKRLRQRIGEERVLVVPCLSARRDELLASLASALGLEATASEDQIAEALRSGKTMVVCIDDAQRLVRPTIEGLEPLDRVEALARAAGGGVSWVLAIDAPAWSFIDRAFGDRVSFDLVVTLPRWTEAQLGDLIRNATERADLDPSFDDLVGRRQIAAVEEEEEERLEQSFYRILWDASDGNASVALRYWRHSLFQDTDGNLVVRMFDEPTSTEVDGSPLPVLFVLRSILQMDVARQEDLAAATNLTQGQVHNALRFAEARGFVEEVDGAVRVTWAWYRTVTRVLKRKRLLVMGA